MKNNNLSEIIKRARREGWGVPHFNVHCLENARACVEAAHELKSPVIIAFTPSTIRFSGLYNLIGMISGLQNQYPEIPIFFHMDHHHNVEELIEGMKLGIKSVMIDNSLLPYEENVANTKLVVDFAKKIGDVNVEAELGLIPGVEDDLVISEAEAGTQYTSPETVLDFIKKTNVDSVAVAIGNAHGIYAHKPKLNIDILKKISAVSDIPLVLHGGSGLTLEQITSCIKNGVAKVNIGTELKPPFVNSLKKFFQDNPKEMDPRKFLEPAVNAIKEVAKQKIKICSSNNKI